MIRLPEIGGRPPQLLLLVVVKGLPEADPYIQQSQAAAEASEEPMGKDGTQARVRKQQVVVGPLWRPGQNNEQHPSHGAD